MTKSWNDTWWGPRIEWYPSMDKTVEGIKKYFKKNTKKMLKEGFTHQDIRSITASWIEDIGGNVVDCCYLPCWAKTCELNPEYKPKKKK